ncbi:MAG: DnaJ-class molecular chaperone, partial [Planctomycetaceae bacterium]
ATDFVAAYSAENKDHGTFTMQKKRPCAECNGSGTYGSSGGACGACGR